MRDCLRVVVVFCGRVVDEWCVLDALNLMCISLRI